jgi:NAD(P)H-dependent FMN reductase
MYICNEKNYTYIIMKNILFIVGSLRKDSFNRQLAKEAEKYLAGIATVNYLDYTEVPFINQDIEYPAPAAVTKLRETVAKADGIWIFTPEYNFSYPGHLKNLLDWLSRPVVAFDFATPTVINGKKVALSGAGGQMATGKCREKLTELLTFIKADVMTEPQTGVTLNAEAWTEGRMILSDEQLATLKAQADAFVKYLG